MGNAQKLIEVFGQEIYIFLQSYVWQERDQALAEITENFNEIIQKNGSHQAFNQIINQFAYSEKNN